MNQACETGEHRSKDLLFFACGNRDIHYRDMFSSYLDALENEPSWRLSVMAPNATDLAEEARGRGHRFFPLSDFSQTLLQKTPQLWPLFSAMGRFRFDVTFCHDGFATRGLRLISRRIVGMCHNDDFSGFSPADQVLMLNSCAMDAAKAVCGDALAIDLLPHPHFCQYDSIKPISESDPLTIGATGPFTADQSLRVFLQAAQMVKDFLPDAQFVIAGSGDNEHELRELADNIAPFVDFAGDLSIHEMIDRFDLFCLTSRQSAYDRTLCAMMDAGIACISTCNNGAMDILRGGMVAPLVPLDDPFSLAKQISELLSDRAQIRRIKKACFSRIREEDFNPDLFSERLNTIMCG